jgi:uncharacterized membrane protein
MERWRATRALCNNAGFYSSAGADRSVAIRVAPSADIDPGQYAFALRVRAANAATWSPPVAGRM